MNDVRVDIERREPRCRVSCDEAVRIVVNELPDWRGVPIIRGRGKTHRVTLTGILRSLEHINNGRDKRDQITYDSLWIHFQRHYSLAGMAAYWRAHRYDEFKKALRG
jgi:hypothetical protein